MPEMYYNTSDTSCNFVKVTPSLIGAAPIYHIPNYSGSTSYARICSMPADIGSGCGGIGALIMGGSNFGGNNIPLIKFSFSTRNLAGGNPNASILDAYYLGDSSGLGFISQKNGSNIDLWFKAAAYPYGVYMVVITSEGVTIRCDSNTTTKPSGTIFEHTMGRIYTTLNKPTCAEIGAATTSHTHDDRYFTESEINTKLNSKANTSHTHTSLAYAGSISGTTNWNNLAAGTYSVASSTAFSSSYNAPVGAYAYGTAIVTSNGSNVSQIYIPHTTGQFYWRDRFASSNTFSGWSCSVSNNNPEVVVSSSQPSGSNAKIWVKV